MTLGDGAEGFDPGERGLGAGYGLEATLRSQPLFYCSMIALNTVVQVLAIDMADCVLWPEPVVDLADHLGIAVRLLSNDGQGLIELAPISTGHLGLTKEA